MKISSVWNTLKNLNRNPKLFLEYSLFLGILFFIMSEAKYSYSVRQYELNRPVQAVVVESNYGVNIKSSFVPEPGVFDRVALALELQRNQAPNDIEEIELEPAKLLDKSPSQNLRRLFLGWDSGFYSKHKVTLVDDYDLEARLLRAINYSQLQYLLKKEPNFRELWEEFSVPFGVPDHIITLPEKQWNELIGLDNGSLKDKLDCFGVSLLDYQLFKSAMDSKKLYFHEGQSLTGQCFSSGLDTIFQLFGKDFYELDDCKKEPSGFVNSEARLSFRSDVVEFTTNAEYKGWFKSIRYLTKQKDWRLKGKLELAIKHGLISSVSNPTEYVDFLNVVDRLWKCYDIGEERKDGAPIAFSECYKTMIAFLDKYPDSPKRLIIFRHWTTYMKRHIVKQKLDNVHDFFSEDCIYKIKGDIPVSLLLP